MAGDGIAKLAAAIAGMVPEDIDRSIDAWDEGRVALDNVAMQLELAAPKILKGFGESSSSGKRAKEALEAINNEVVVPRGQDMTRASEALVQVKGAMHRAKAKQATMPDSPPGPAPAFTGGTGDERDDITRMKIHAGQMRTHHRQVAAYGDSDEEARQEVIALNRDYDEAARVMADIHGEPVREGPGQSPGTGTGDSGSGSGSTPPGPTRGGPRRLPPGTIGGTHTVDTVPTQNPTDTDQPDPVRPDQPDPVRPDQPDPVQPDPVRPDPTVTGPTPDPTTGEPTNTGSSFDPDQGSPLGPPAGSAPTSSGGGPGPGALGGGAAAGVLGGMGVKGLLGGRLGGAAVTGAAGSAGSPSTRTIGAGGRAGTSGVLGRAGATGQPISRNPGPAGTAGTAGRTSGAAGRGAGAAGAGSARGAGAGGRAGGAGGRGGRKKDARDPGRKNEYDVEEEWLDDEGSSGVLG